jgi:hypothetical protein
MTSQKKTATLSEWAAKLEEIWEQMEGEGYEWDFTSCCCGEGLILRDREAGESKVIY